MAVTAPPNCLQTNSKHLQLLLLTLCIIVGFLRPVQCLCGCAETFASNSDLTNNTDYYFRNKRNGETIIFSSARFHCSNNLTKVNYEGQLEDCRNDCDGYSLNSNSDSSPELQLWRKSNDTLYELNTSIVLPSHKSSLDLRWPVQPNDVIGLWVPSLCSCSGSILRIGYFFGGSRRYVVEGKVDVIDTLEYDLEDGPIPMITVETNEDLNPICVIGLPTGGIIFLIALGFTCAGICWSINLYNKKVERKGKLVIDHPLHNDDEIEMEEINGMTDEIMSNQFDHLERVDSATSISSRPLPPIPTTNIDDADFPEDPNVSSSPRLPGYTGNGATGSSIVPYSTVVHSMSNPDLSHPHQYGNITGPDDQRRFMSLERKHPQPAPRASVRSYHGQQSYSPRTSIDYQKQQQNGLGSYNNTRPSIDQQQGVPQFTAPPTTINNKEMANTPLPNDQPASQSMVGSVGPEVPLPPPPMDPLPPQMVPVQDESQEVIPYDRNSEYEVSDGEGTDAGEVEDEYLSIHRPDNIDEFETDSVYY